MENLLEIKQRTENGVLIISLFGILNESGLAEIDARLSEVGSGRIVLDLTRLDYINSQGISILLTAWRRARREGGSFVLGAPRGAVRKIFDIAHIGNFIPLRETIEEAVQAAAKSVKAGSKPAPAVTTN